MQADGGLVLDKYSTLFEEPKGSASRTWICAQNPYEVMEPVNVRPYRYAYYQKEIEKQVADMLNRGLIQESQSPFSSPVLLVKKKDMGFLYRLPCCALNEVRIKDRFPIPTVLDELNGAQFFSKLDLRAGPNPCESIHLICTKTLSELTTAI